MWLIIKCLQFSQRILQMTGKIIVKDNPIRILKGNLSSHSRESSQKKIFLWYLSINATESYILYFYEL